MSLITLSMKHGQTREEARNRLEAAVNEVRKLFGALIQHMVWSADRTQVRSDGEVLPRRATTKTHGATIRAASRVVIIDIDKPCHPCIPKNQRTASI